MPPPGFQWREAKNRTNIREHGIDFNDAVRLFEKPTLDTIDDREAYPEERVNSLGELDGQVILNVTHTERSGEIRLISARLATSAERKLYREFQHELASQQLDPGQYDKWAEAQLSEARQRHQQRRKQRREPKVRRIPGRRP